MGRRLPWAIRALRRGFREGGPPENAEAERQSVCRGNRTPPLHTFLSLHFPSPPFGFTGTAPRSSVAPRGLVTLCRHGPCAEAVRAPAAARRMQSCRGRDGMVRNGPPHGSRERREKRSVFS